MTIINDGFLSFFPCKKKEGETVIVKMFFYIDELLRDEILIKVGSLLSCIDEREGERKSMLE